MGVLNRRALRPSLHRLEGRELLSAIIALEASQVPKVAAALTVLNARINSATANPPGAGFAAISGNTGGSVGNGLNNNKNSPLLGNGFPTPRELARESYRATFSGRVYTGPGRFTDQGTTYFFRGLGGSNMFLHGDFNMAVVTPTDPAAPFLGEAVLNDKSTNSAAIQGFEMQGDRTSVDRLGRPTHLTFTADPNIYSGAFFVEAAQGTVDITYGAKNAATVRFNGLVYTTGLASPLVNEDLYARQGRPVPYHPSSSLAKIHNS